MAQADPKTIVDAACNAAIMGAFCVPEIGPVIAAGLAGGQALFDIIFNIADPAPENQMLTHSDMTAAITTISQKMDKTAWLTLYQPHYDEMTAMNDGIVAMMADRGKQVETVLTQGFVTHIIDQTWQTAYAQCCDYVTDPKSPLYLATDFIEGLPSHTVDTLDLYCFAVGNFILACKFGLATEYAKVMQANKLLTARSDTAIDAAKQAVLAWKFQPKATRGQMPTVPAAFDALLSPKDIKGNSFYVTQFRDKLKLFITYIQAIIDTIGGAYAAVDQQLATRAASVTIAKDYAGHFTLTDSQAPFTQTFATMSMAQMGRETYLAPFRAALWQSLVVAKGYDAVPLSKIATLKTLVSDWTSGRDDAVNFLSANGVP